MSVENFILPLGSKVANEVMNSQGEGSMWGLRENLGNNYRKHSRNSVSNPAVRRWPGFEVKHILILVMS